MGASRFVCREKSSKVGRDSGQWSVTPCCAPVAKRTQGRQDDTRAKTRLGESRGPMSAIGPYKDRRRGRSPSWLRIKNQRPYKLQTHRLRACATSQRIQNPTLCCALRRAQGAKDGPPALLVPRSDPACPALATASRRRAGPPRSNSHPPTLKKRAWGTRKYPILCCAQGAPFLRPFLRQGKQASRMGHPPLLVSQRHHGIDAHGAAGGDVAGEQRDDEQHSGNHGKRERIGGTDLEEQR